MVIVFEKYKLRPPPFPFCFLLMLGRWLVRGRCGGVTNEAITPTSLSSPTHVVIVIVIAILVIIIVVVIAIVKSDSNFMTPGC